VPSPAVFASASRWNLKISAAEVMRLADNFLQKQQKGHSARETTRRSIPSARRAARGTVYRRRWARGGRFDDSLYTHRKVTKTDKISRILWKNFE
jgi:hypothetical protein